MTAINVLELALRDPSRLTADLTGHPRSATNRLHTARGLRRAHRRNPGRRPTADAPASEDWE